MRIPGLAAAALLAAASLVAALLPAPAGAQALTVTILSPVQDETIHDNLGNVPVVVSIEGDAPPGARLRVLLDGRSQGPDRPPGPLTLTEVERGQHTLQVQLVDAACSVMASSGVVTFTLWRASRLFPARKP